MGGKDKMIARREGRRKWLHGGRERIAQREREGNKMIAQREREERGREGERNKGGDTHTQMIHGKG